MTRFLYLLETSIFCEHVKPTIHVKPPSPSRTGVLHSSRMVNRITPKFRLARYYWSSPSSEVRSLSKEDTFISHLSSSINFVLHVVRYFPTAANPFCSRWFCCSSFSRNWADSNPCLPRCFPSSSDSQKCIQHFQLQIFSLLEAMHLHCNGGKTTPKRTVPTRSPASLWSFWAIRPPTTAAVCVILVSWGISAANGMPYSVILSGVHQA